MRSAAAVLASGAGAVSKRCSFLRMDGSSKLTASPAQNGSNELKQRTTSYGSTEHQIYFVSFPDGRDSLAQLKYVNFMIYYGWQARGVDALAFRQARLRQNGLHTCSPLMNLPWTHASMPAISLPAGFAAYGLPLGLQCVCGYMKDELLLQWSAMVANVVQKLGDASQ